MLHSMLRKAVFPVQSASEDPGRYRKMQRNRKIQGKTENKNAGSGVILASGMSEYNPESDRFVSDIFERADKEMYENKQKLKA